MNSFTECVYKYLQFLRVVKNASEHTIRNYSVDLMQFKSFFNADDISGIDKRSIRAYLTFLVHKGAAKKTILRRLAALRSLFKFLLKEKWIASNPLEEIDTPKLEKRLPLSLNYEQIERLLAQADVNSYLGLRDRAIMELFYSSALRLSELVLLDREDFDRNVLRLRLKGKGKKQRDVPITKTAAKWLMRYLDHPERHLDTEEHRSQVDTRAIFLNKWGKRLTARSVDRSMQKHLKTSGLSGKITPHTIRHTIATHWLENGMDLKTIQMLLGHSSLATTTIYTQVSSSLKRAVYDKTHPLALKEEKL